MPTMAPSAPDFPAPPARAPQSSSPKQPVVTPLPSTVPRAHYFHYGQRSVKARIDPEVPLDEVLRQLCASPQLSVSEPPALFALRERDSGALMTQENMRALLAQATTFQLVSSPMLQAVELVEKLSSTNATILKPATFSLRTLVKDRAFLAEFVARGGIPALQGVIRRASGNTLAYALLSLQAVLEVEDKGWMGLDRNFLPRLVEIIATEPLINISRPATAVLRRLASTPIQPPASPSTSATSSFSLQSGFEEVYKAIDGHPNFLRIVVTRLGGEDVEVTNLSLGLLDTLLRGSNELGDLRLADELDGLDAWRAVGKLLDGSKGADPSTLLTLQSNLIASLHLALTTPIIEEHFPHFDQVWIASRLEDSDESNRWRRLGFMTESPQYEFAKTGLLGLKALRRFAEDSQNEFSQTLQDQLTRPEARRCPLSTLSERALLILAEHFGLVGSDRPAASSLTPYLFRFYDLHALVVQCLVRLWTDSGAGLPDLDRIVGLGRSEVSFVLGSGSGPGQPTTEKTWFTVRREFLNADYRQIRDRQMRELEVEDDLLNKAPIRHLRDRLYRESYEFVRNQRIACLHQGAWFSCIASSGAAHPITSSGSGSGHAARRASGQSKAEVATRWRFYRLAANRKALHWCEAAEKREIKPGMDDLPRKLDIASIVEILPSPSALTANGGHRNGRLSQTGGGLARPGSVVSTGPPGAHDRAGTAPRLSFLLPKEHTSNDKVKALKNHEAPLSFTLVTAEGPPVELTAPTPSVCSEWVDGLSMLRHPDSGSISTSETAEYIQALCDIGVKIKLLDLSGERVEVQTKGDVPGLPANTDFFYADSL